MNIRCCRPASWMAGFPLPGENPPAAGLVVASYWNAWEPVLLGKPYFRWPQRQRWHYTCQFPGTTERSHSSLTVTTSANKTFRQTASCYDEFAVFGSVTKLTVQQITSTVAGSLPVHMLWIPTSWHATSWMNNLRAALRWLWGVEPELTPHPLTQNGWRSQGSTVHLFRKPNLVLQPILHDTAPAPFSILTWPPTIPMDVPYKVQISSRWSSREINPP